MKGNPGRPRLLQFCTHRLDVEVQENVCGETPASFFLILLIFSILPILFIPQIQPEVRFLVGA
jgi:hypothetical protein